MKQTKEEKNFNKRLEKKLSDLRLSNEQIDEIIARCNLTRLDIKQMAQVELLIDKARWSTNVPDARTGLILEWLWSVIYGEVTPEQRKLIDAHLKDIEKLFTQLMGADSTDSEKHSYKLYCEEKIIMITRINEGFGNSIKIQLD